MPVDIAALEGEIRTLHDAISKFHDAKHPDRLMAFIRKPGWTTPREDELVRAHVRSLNSQISNVHQAFDMLLTIAAKIGET